MNTHMQAWAIRDSQRAWQRQTGAIFMMKGEAQRARSHPTRIVMERASPRRFG